MRFMRRPLRRRRMKRLTRPVWMAAGIFFVALGTLGIFLPLLPTVVFYLLAAWCFSQSHPAWAEKLYNHPTHGNHLRHWRDRRALTRNSKVAATEIGRATCTERMCQA